MNGQFEPIGRDQYHITSIFITNLQIQQNYVFKISELPLRPRSEPNFHQFVALTFRVRHGKCLEAKSYFALKFATH